MLGSASAQDDQGQAPVPAVPQPEPLPQVPQPVPTPPGGVPPTIPGRDLTPTPPTAPPGGLVPPTGASPGALPVPVGSAEPGGPPIPGPAPASGAAPTGGGSGATATFRVTQDRLLGPIGSMRERGRTLFHSKTLGRATLACSTCHRQNDLTAVARAYPRFNPFLRDVATLEQAQNACLARFMRGSPLPYWSRNAVALSIYLVGE